MNYSSLFTDCVKTGILDSTVSSPIVNSNRELAKLILDKLNSLTAEKSEDALRAFAIELIAQLSCFTSLEAAGHHKAINWGQYHKYRSSPLFREMWIKFLSDITGKIPYPTFYQSITHEIIKSLIEKRYQRSTRSTLTKSSETTATETAQDDLVFSVEEQNALRYACGYIIRKVRYSLDKVKGKEDMISCLIAMLADEIDEDRGADKWCKMIDRGGLWHVSDETYELFVAIETEIRQYYKPQQSSFPNCKFIEDDVFDNEKVQFCWSLLSLSIQDDIATELLKIIVKQYVTVRGFYFAISFVEMYKKDHNKLLQK